MTASLWSALALSLQVAFVSTVLALPVATLLGYWLARARFAAKPLVELVLLLPLVLPPVVVGYGLLEIFGRRSSFAAMTGLALPFTRGAAMLAAFVVGLPLFIMSARTAFMGLDERYEALAATLGLSRIQAFLRVVLPMGLPGVLAGAVLCFARSLGEFGATAVFAGNSEGETRTLSLAVYALLEAPEANIGAFVWTSVGLAAFCLLVYEGLVTWHRKR